MTWPREIHRGADGYTTMRLQTYDLSVAQWKKIVKSATGRRAVIALSEGGGARIGTEVQLWPDGSMYFYTRSEPMPSTEFDTASEAMQKHEELAKDITDRIDLMEAHDVAALQEGAL